MITPEIGKAVLFYNMLPDGNMDDLSQHASAFFSDVITNGIDEVGCHSRYGHHYSTSSSL